MMEDAAKDRGIEDGKLVLSIHDFGLYSDFPIQLGCMPLVPTEQELLPNLLTYTVKLLLYYLPNEG
jgi:hypothetical protein